jgi:CheY-like chemotaxis protein
MAKILIVEDEAIVALATKLMLSEMSHHTFSIVSSAEQAILNSANEVVDLILMDIKLKGETDGIIAAHEIRKNKEIPILFVTGNSDQRTRRRVEQVSNSFILFKPVMMDDLKASVDKLLNDVQ